MQKSKFQIIHVVSHSQKYQIYNVLSYQYRYETSNGNMCVHNDFLLHVISVFWNDWNTYLVK